VKANAFHPLVTYWRGFQNQFRRAVNENGLPALMNAWMGEDQRTLYYSETIFPEVAEKLGLRLEMRLLNVDFAMCSQDGSGLGVPLAFIESENKIATTKDEIRKLCCVSAPLRVLVTVAEWDDTPGTWKHGGRKREFLALWETIIKRHFATWPQPAVFGILVGEASFADTRLRFYTHAFGPAGECLDGEDEVALEFAVKEPWPRNPTG